MDSTDAHQAQTTSRTNVALSVNEPIFTNVCGHSTHDVLFVGDFDSKASPIGRHKRSGRAHFRIGGARNCKCHISPDRQTSAGLANHPREGLIGGAVAVIASGSAGMAPFMGNPFAALTIVVAPAILTNASSVLCLGTGNRLARVMDRTRVVAAQAAALAPNLNERATYHEQLKALGTRSNLVLRALRFFYVSLGSFAAATLISLLGSILTATAVHDGLLAIAVLGLISGTVGVTGLVIGCTNMVQETRLAVDDLREEVNLAMDPDGVGQARSE